MKWRCINVSFLLILRFTLINFLLTLTLSRTEVSYLLPNSLDFRDVPLEYNLTFVQLSSTTWLLVCSMQEEKQKENRSMLIPKFHRFRMLSLDLNKALLSGYSGSAYPLRCPILQWQTSGSRLCTRCTKLLGLDLSTHLTFTHGWTISFYW